MAQEPLTTVTKVKDYLRQPVGENAELMLSDFATIASRMVREFTRRRFTTPRTTEVREFRTYGLDTVYVDELLSAADVISVTGEDGVPLEADLDFSETLGGSQAKGCVLRVQPLYATYGGLSNLPQDHGDLFIRNFAGAQEDPSPKLVRVEATFGYDPLGADGEYPIPPDVEFATRRAVALWYKEEIAHYTQDAFISRGRMFEPEMLPPISASMLKPWKVETPLIL